jgi:hypothetical protein
VLPLTIVICALLVLPSILHALGLGIEVPMSIQIVILALAFVVIGVQTVLLSVFHSRIKRTLAAREHVPCPSCEYPLHPYGLPSTAQRCPECGCTSNAQDALDAWKRVVRLRTIELNDPV